MSEKPPRSPQQKKALSRSRDCRNTFGESSTAARKSIPLRKALENRRVRHENNQALSLAERFDEAGLALVESSARHNIARVGGWKKTPDRPLGELIDDAASHGEHRARRHVYKRHGKGNVC
jgi:hypothetical protein